jgi:hypothetical protein
MAMKASVIGLARWAAAREQRVVETWRLDQVARRPEQNGEPENRIVSSNMTGRKNVP